MRMNSLQENWDEILHLAQTSPLEIDERLPDLWRLRYAQEEMALPAAQQDRTLAALLESARATNLKAQRRHAQKVAVFAFAAAAVLILVVWLTVRPARQPILRRQPPTRSPSLPRTKPAPGPSPEKGLLVHKSPRKSSPRPAIKRQIVVARRLPIGHFEAVVGRPQVVASSGASASAMPRAALYAGSRIVTGDADQCVLRFEDGTTLTLGFNTTLEIPASAQKPGRKRPSEVHLDGGIVAAKVTHRADEQFGVLTKIASAYDLGTEFSLRLRKSVAGDGATLRVTRGKVRFANERGAVIVTSQTQSSAIGGSAPTEPKRLANLGSQYLMGTSFVSPSDRLTPLTAVGRYVYRNAWVGWIVTHAADGSYQLTSVVTGGPAAKAGLQPGDTIESIDGVPVKADLQADRAVWTSGGKPLLLRIRRGQDTLLVTLRPPLDPTPLPQMGPDGQKVIDATTLAQGGKVEAAKAMLMPLAQQGQPAALNNLGVLYELDDRLADAIQYYSRAARADDRVALYHYNLGSALMQIGNIDRACEELIRTVELSPTWENAYGRLTRALDLAGRPEESMRYAQQGFDRLSPYRRGQQLLLELSKLLLDAGRFDEAQRAAEKATKDDPTDPNAWYGLGNALSRQGLLSGAVAAFRRALSIDPTRAQYWCNYGTALQDSQDLAGAEEAARKAIELSPDVSAFRTNHANALLGLGKAAQAEKEQRIAIRLDSGNVMAHVGLAASLQTLGRLDEARKELAIALEIEPHLARAYSDLGSIEWRQGHLAQAERAYQMAVRTGERGYGHVDLANFFLRTGRMQQAEAENRKAIEANPHDIFALSNLPTILEAEGRRDDALVAWRACVREFPDNGWLHRELGRLLAASGQQTEAEAELRKAIELKPDLAPTYVDLGTLLMGTNRLKEAEPLLRKAVELAPGDMPPYNQLGLALKAMHRYAEAEQTLRKAISVAPNVPQPYENLGLVLIDEEKLAEAAPMLQKAISLAPENPDLRGRIARAFEAMGRLSDAETQYREELRLAPGSPVAMNDLAWHLAQRGIKLDEALDLAQRAAKALPNDGGVLDTLGWAYFLKHDYARAEDSLQKALRLLGADNTDAPDVYVHLGKVFEEEKRIEDAVAAYREAIKRNPDQAEAAAALKRLGRKLF